MYVDTTAFIKMVQKAYVIEGRVKYVFYPPPLLSDQIRKIIWPTFWKKARRRRKNFGVPFFKNLLVFQNSGTHFLCAQHWIKDCILDSLICLRWKITEVNKLCEKIEFSIWRSQNLTLIHSYVLLFLTGNAFFIEWISRFSRKKLLH